MKCDEARELMSAYFDDEIASELHAKIAEHIGNCADCSSELAAFQRISLMAEVLPDPNAPAQIWDEIESELDGEKHVSPAKQSVPRKHVGIKVASIAAVLLIALGIGWFGYQAWFASHDHAQDELAVDLSQYLDRFRKSPQEAQNVLLERYEGAEVGVPAATTQVGYRPIVADGVPERYSVGKMYVMDMPCCKCVQCLCQRDDGKVVAVFEHDDEEPVWFGERPTTTAHCNGKRCSIVQLDNQLAASWKHGRRYITVVGVGDLEEVHDWVKWFSRNDVAKDINSS